jgi:hypothetical protein
MIVYYSGADNHVAAVPETILAAACVMTTYGEHRLVGGGNSRFKRLLRVRCFSTTPAGARPISAASRPCRGPSS